MDTVTYSEARANFKAMMDKVWDNCEPLIISRQGGRPVVMLSLDEYNQLDTTAYLLSNPVNAERLLRGMEDVKNGNYKEYPIDLDDV